MRYEHSRICILIPYFGHWPFWMPLFLESCRFNPTIDWIIYTDCGKVESCPDNVKVVDIKFKDYCKLVSTKLGIGFMPKNAYKLCDMRPALGYIHRDEIAHYDFWGYSDIDLVYGDLRAYFTNELLRSKDLFSTTLRRVAGHLCVIRNSPAMQTAFMQAKDWKRVFSSQEHAAFDEKHFSKIFLRYKNSPSYVRWLVARFDPWLTVADFNETHVTPNAKIPWVDGTYDFPTAWYWRNGKVTNNLTGGREFPYFHFMVWKTIWPKNTLPLDTSNLGTEVKISAIGFQSYYST